MGDVRLRDTLLAGDLALAGLLDLLTLLDLHISKSRKQLVSTKITI